MANSKVQYTADGNTQAFGVTFPFISRSHITVEVDGTTATFSFNSDSEILISSPTLAGAEKVLVKRTTSQGTRLVDYVDGSNLSETDLDTDSLQAFYMAQEALDELDSFADANLPTSGNILIADGTDFESVAVTGDVTLSSAGVLTIGAGQVETAMIAADAINGTRLADNAVDSEHYTDGSIDTVHIADVNVTTAKIANDAITGAKIELFDDSYAATNTHILVADGTDFDNVAVTGDITISNAGVTAIASEVIANADINGSAAIDASKIHNGTVSNAEFGYLDGVTSAIQTQITNIEAGTVANIDDDNFTLLDNADGTKKAQFQCSGITAGATRTLTVPDASDTIVGKATTDTFTNKTFDANGTGNSLSNVDVADLANGTDGQLITWGADAAPTTVATGTSGQILTSAGAGAPPTFETAVTGATNGFAIAMAVAL